MPLDELLELEEELELEEDEFELDDEDELDDEELEEDVESISLHPASNVKARPARQVEKVFCINKVLY